MSEDINLELLAHKLNNIEKYKDEINFWGMFIGEDGLKVKMYKGKNELIKLLQKAQEEIIYKSELDVQKVYRYIKSFSDYWYLERPLRKNSFDQKKLDVKINEFFDPIMKVYEQIQAQKGDIADIVSYTNKMYGTEGEPDYITWWYKDENGKVIPKTFGSSPNEILKHTNYWHEAAHRVNIGRNQSMLQNPLTVEIFSFNNEYKIATEITTYAPVRWYRRYCKPTNQWKADHYPLYYKYGYLFGATIGLYLFLTEKEIPNEACSWYGENAQDLFKILELPEIFGKEMQEVLLDYYKSQLSSGMPVFPKTDELIIKQNFADEKHKELTEEPIKIIKTIKL